MARRFSDDEIRGMFAAHQRSGIGSTAAIAEAVNCDPTTARRYQAMFNLLSRYQLDGAISRQQWIEVQKDAEFAPLRGVKMARDMMSGVARACSPSLLPLLGRAAAEDHYRALCVLCDSLRALLGGYLENNRPTRIVVLTGSNPDERLVAEEGLFGDEGALLPALEEHAPDSAAWPNLRSWTASVSELLEQSERLNAWISIEVARAGLDRPGGAALLLERSAREFALGATVNPNDLGPMRTTRDGTHELLQIGSLMVAQSPLGTDPPDADAVLTQLLSLRDRVLQRRETAIVADRHRRLRDLAPVLRQEVLDIRLDGFPGTCRWCRR